jgi:hypothetical protein
MLHSFVLSSSVRSVWPLLSTSSFAHAVSIVSTAGGNYHKLSTQ